MGTYTAARDARQLMDFRAALKQLLKAGERGSTGRALIGLDYRKASGRTFLERLVLHGYARFEPGRDERGPFSAKTYFAEPVLEELLDNDEELAGLVWPSQAPQEVPQEAGPVPAPVATPVTSAAADDGDAPTDRQLLEATVRMLSAVVEGLAGINATLRETRDEIEHLRKQWE